MGKYYILYNPFASNGKGELSSKGIFQYLPDKELVFTNMTKINSYSDFFAGLEPDDRIVLCGGDGTLNHFVNDCNDEIPANEIYLFPVGTGNDFLLDLGFKGKCAPVLINDYIRDLPWVEINGERHFFVDNVAFGIDGWVCEIADKQKAANPKAKINYTTIAVKGLLGAYRPCNAKVCVDGITKEYRKVWMAPAMNGRYFGGGMKVTPDQDRMNPEHTITLMLFQGLNRLQTAAEFPSIFSGKHVNNPHSVFHVGHEIQVEFDEPRAVQIDGEVILGVTKYKAVRR